MDSREFYEIGKENLETVEGEMDVLLKAYATYFRDIAIAVSEEDEREEDLEDMMQAGRVAFWKWINEFSTLINHTIKSESEGRDVRSDVRKIHCMLSTKVREAMQEERVKIMGDVDFHEGVEQGSPPTQETALILRRGFQAAQQETDPADWALFVGYELEGQTLKEVKDATGVDVGRNRISQRIVLVRNRIKKKISPDELSPEEVEANERLRLEINMTLQSLKAELKRIPERIGGLTKERSTEEKNFSKTLEEGRKSKDVLWNINVRINTLERDISYKKGELLAHQNLLESNPIQRITVLDQGISALESELATLFSSRPSQGSGITQYRKKERELGEVKEQREDLIQRIQKAKHAIPQLQEELPCLEAEVLKLKCRKSEVVIQVEAFKRLLDQHEKRTLRPLLERTQALKKREGALKAEIAQLEEKLRQLDGPKPESAPPLSF